MWQPGAGRKRLGVDIMRNTSGGGQALLHDPAAAPKIRAPRMARCLSLACLLVLAPASGATARATSAGPDISLTAVLGQPPALHSPQDEADRAAVIAAVAARSPARQEQAILDAEATIARFLEGMDVHLPKKGAR